LVPFPDGGNDFVGGQPMPGAAASHARRTSRLAKFQRHVGLALGDAAVAQLTQRLGLPVSGSTLLRLVRGRMRGCPGPQPRVIDIDDWASRRGHRYGSIVCDLERRRIVDLLPDRAAAMVEDWLSRHPGIAVIARDRGGAYGPAVNKHRTRTPPQNRSTKLNLQPETANRRGPDQR
jgi:transposase